MVPDGMSPRLAARRAARYGDGAGAPPPPPPLEPPAGRPPGRRDRRWGPSRWSRRWRWVLGGLAALVLAVALAPPPLVDPVVDRAAGRYQSECAELSGLQVDSGSWPAVARAGLGDLRNVSAHTDEVRFGDDLVIHDVDFSADRVEVPPMRFGTVEGDVVVHGGRSTATVLLADIERLLSTDEITVDLRGEGSSMVADVQVPLVGAIPTTVELVPVDGDLELQLAALAVITLPSLRISFPEPVSLEDVEVRGSGLLVTTRVEGTIGADDWACEGVTSVG